MTTVNMEIGERKRSLQELKRKQSETYMKNQKKGMSWKPKR